MDGELRKQLYTVARGCMPCAQSPLNLRNVENGVAVFLYVLWRTAWLTLLRDDYWNVRKL
jgi:hypothetical protein